jgi:hypothetical protein
MKSQIRLDENFGTRNQQEYEQELFQQSAAISSQIKRKPVSTINFGFE